MSAINRVRHGWTVYGPSGHATNNEQSDISCNRISLRETCSEIITPIDAIRVLELDFNSHNACHPDDKGMSHEDLVQDGLRLQTGDIQSQLKSTDISFKQIPGTETSALARQED